MSVEFQRRIAGLSPLAKIGLCVTFVVFWGGLLQLAAWQLGLSMSLLTGDGGGDGVLLGLALTSLILMVSLDRLAPADYGLVVEGSMVRRCLRGFGLGVATAGAYFLVVLLAGAAHLSAPDPERLGKALLKAGTVFPLAVTQQFIFSGYLLTLFRSKYGTLPAVTVTAAAFGVLNELDRIGNPSFPLMTGLALVAALLCLLRLRCGDILLPAGVLAGWLFVRRMLFRSSLLTMAPESPWYAWLTPNGDLRQAPLCWLLLAAAIVVTARMSGRQAPQGGRPRKTPAPNRYLPVAGIAHYAPLDLWLRQLWQAGGRVGWRYVPRLVFSLGMSAINTVVSLPERLLAPWLLRKQPVADPVFIVGIHRSGTTHLHNLLALDDRFVAPLSYQVNNPTGFLVCGWLLFPLWALFSMSKRPMDNVRMSFLSPQEEEFALHNAIPHSAHWAQVFPRAGDKFARFACSDGFTPAERRTWQAAMKTFLQKLVFRSGKTPLLKNPFNTGRVSMLTDMFPRAKFIHIRRHPEDVYRSNQNLQERAHALAQLQEQGEDTYVSRFPQSTRASLDAFYADTAPLSAGQVAEVSFEELEQDPVGVVRGIYGQLGLEWTGGYEQRLRDYLADLRGYQKNPSRPLPADQQALLLEHLELYFSRWGYRPREPAAADGRTAAHSRRAA